MVYIERKGFLNDSEATSEGKLLLVGVEDGGADAQHCGALRDGP